jgi:hypothetical protein
VRFRGPDARRPARPPPSSPRVSGAPYSITFAPNSNRAYAPSFVLGVSGVFAFDVGCDGTITDRGRFLAGEGSFLTFLPNGKQAVLAGRAAGNSPPLEFDTFLIDMQRASLIAQGRIAGGSMSGEFSSLAITPDGRYALMTDRAPHIGQHLGIVEVSTMHGPRTIPVPDPTEVLASPFNDAALVVSEGSNEIYDLAYNPSNIDEPFKVRGVVPHTFGRPKDLFSAVQITTGHLKGRVLATDGNTIRQLQFAEDGSLSNVSRFVMPGTSERDTLWTIGIQP